MPSLAAQLPDMRGVVEADAVEGAAASPALRSSPRRGRDAASSLRSREGIAGDLDDAVAFEDAVGRAAPAENLIQRMMYP